MKNINDKRIHIINPQLSLQKYSSSKQKILESYRSDRELRPYLYSTDSLYLLKCDNKYAGYCYLFELSRIVKYHEGLMMSLGLTQTFRSDYKTHQSGIGTYVLTSISNYVFENYDYPQINLDIKWDNVPSRKSAIKAGFDVDYNLSQVYEEEGYKYISYVRMRQ